MPSLDFYPFLKISNSPVLSKFLHECVDDLIGEKELNFDNYNSDIEWTFADYNIAKSSIQSFYRESASRDTFELSASDLSDSIQQAIKDCYEVRKQDILQALVEEHILARDHNLVDSFDWKLKWVLGSSTLASVREPLLQVDLQCVDSHGDAKRSSNVIAFEMDLKACDNLISELEKASELLK